MNITSLQDEDIDGKLQTAANSGDIPDVFLARGGGKTAAMVDAGVVKDLTDLISDDTHSAIGDAAFSAFTIDGSVYAVPASVLPEGIFYSEDLFEAAGIDAAPTTFDELDTAVQKLKELGYRPDRAGREGRLARRPLVLLVRDARLLAGDPREHRRHDGLLGRVLAVGCGAARGVRCYRAVQQGLPHD